MAEPTLTDDRVEGELAKSIKQKAVLAPDAKRLIPVVSPESEVSISFVLRAAVYAHFFFWFRSKPSWIDVFFIFLQDTRHTFES